jgi:[ribosomal protein S5]-alanine N-acetyltransferase
MEMMPYQPLFDRVADDAPCETAPPLTPTLDATGALIGGTAPVAPPVFGPRARSLRLGAAWRAALPLLHGARLTLRELRMTDAPILLALLTTEEVARFISPPPRTVEEFEGFVAWAHRKREKGTYACFAVVPEGGDAPVGIFQIRALSADFTTAEWGFALGAQYWGRGLFLDGALQLLRFAFETLGVRRLEARACVENGRANGALRKVGAVREGVLRQAFSKDGRYHDQFLWTILRHQWWPTTVMTASAVH